MLKMQEPAQSSLFKVSLFPLPLAHRFFKPPCNTNKQLVFFITARAIKFIRPLEETTRVVEREEVVFEIELSHCDVEVIWYKNGAKMARTLKNIELTSEGTVHRMVIHRASMDDYGVEIVAQAEEESSMTTFFVEGT